jgi:hypothetical protein
MKKENRGGKRKNAGAKLKYSEKTETVSFRCPESKVTEIKTIINNKLNDYKNG